MKIAAMGDSITEGYMCNPRDGWVSIVGRDLGIKMFNLGVPGDLTRNMKRRFQRQLLSLAPSHCLILGGTNDAFCEIDLDDYSENIMFMVEYCVKNGIVPILGLPVPSLGPEEFILQEYREWLKEYEEKEKIQIIDFYSSFLDSQGTIKEEYYLDEVHPNAAGYRIMAEVAKIAIRDMLHKK